MPKPRARRKPARRPAARPGAASSHASSSRRPKSPLVAEPAPGARGRVERSTAGLLVWLSSRPRWFVPALSGAVLLAGLFAPPGIGVPLLLLLVTFVGWLVYLSWPAVAGRGRLVRVGLLALLVYAVVGRLPGG